MVYVITVLLYAKDDRGSIDKVAAKLKEASLVYSRDRETISWFVSQDVSDPRSFIIVERYEHESSQKYHLENPYWQTFNPYVEPLLAKPMQLFRSVELVAPPSATADVPTDSKVERDSELWDKVVAHQSHVKSQGNY